MSTLQNHLAVVLLLLAAAGAPGDDRTTGKPTDAEHLQNGRELARQLVREVERLQEDIVADLGERKERRLYQQTDAVLALSVRLEGAFTAKVSPEDLVKSFDQMDRQLHELLKAVRELGPEQRALRRTADHVESLDEQLHYHLFSGSAGEERMKQLLQRQSGALDAAAHELERTARYALSAAPGRGTLEADLKKLADATERFRKSMAGSASRDQQQREFATINEIWDRVVRGMKDLPPGQNVYLLRSAGQVDLLHERLHRMLGIKDKRPELIIRT
jgi:hypothetical protein